MVTTQGGVQLQVAVPPGIQPGQTFQVAFQAALPTMPMATPVARGRRWQTPVARGFVELVG